MVTRGGGAYLGNFIQYDGRRKSMSVGRPKVKLEEKTGTSNAPDSVAHEFRRAMDRYQDHWTDMDASGGRGNRRKNVRPKSKSTREPPGRSTASRGGNASTGFRVVPPSEIASRRIAATPSVRRPK